jgi:hypothetical protein
MFGFYMFKWIVESQDIGYQWDDNPTNFLIDKKILQLKVHL